MGSKLIERKRQMIQKSSQNFQIKLEFWFHSLHYLPFILLLTLLSYLLILPNHYDL
jgi:hypothetical protein